VNELKILYRGSPNKDSIIFDPKETVGNDSSARLVVSATADRNAATRFIVPGEDLPIKIGTTNGTHYYLCGDEKTFRNMDRGGAVYSLPVIGFEYDNISGVWVSSKPVEPIAREVFSSGLDAMISSGVQVYFVNLDTFDRFSRSPNERINILIQNRSENQRRNQNIKDFSSNLT